MMMMMMMMMTCHTAILLELKSNFVSTNQLIHFLSQLYIVLHVTMEAIFVKLPYSSLNLPLPQE